VFGGPGSGIGGSGFTDRLFGGSGFTDRLFGG
jgi:hypothetical protein